METFWIWLCNFAYRRVVAANRGRGRPMSLAARG